MKTSLRILAAIALVAAVAQPVLAAPPGRTVPDGGASALLVTLGAAGLVAARGMFRKK